MSTPVPARSWPSARTAAFTLNVEETDPGDLAVGLWIGDPSDGVSVLLDRTQTGELVTDLLRRLALIAGRHAALCAAADPSIAAQRGPRPADRDPDVVDAVIYCGEHHPTLECTSCGRESRHDGLCRGIDPRTGVVHDWHAADPSIAEQRGDRPDRVWTLTGWPTDHVWTATASGRDALRGPEPARTDLPGGLTPTDPRSPGSGSAGGAR